MTRKFHIHWEMDIMADSHEEAVEKALMIQRNPFSDATVFTAIDGETGDEQMLDAESHSHVLNSDLSEEACVPGYVED